jgi:hypothetical protein
MITIFFERDGSVCESVHFATEACYITCYSALEHYARIHNLVMSEMTHKHGDPSEQWHETHEASWNNT